MPKAGYLKKLKERARKNISTREQALADEIYGFFGKKLEFRVLMGIIRNKGYQAVREIWSDVKHSKAKNPLALFLWRVKKETIEWKKDRR